MLFAIKLVGDSLGVVSCTETGHLYLFCQKIIPIINTLHYSWLLMALKPKHNDY